MWAALFYVIAYYDVTVLRAHARVCVSDLFVVTFCWPEAAWDSDFFVFLGFCELALMTRCRDSFVNADSKLYRQGKITAESIRHGISV